MKPPETHTRTATGTPGQTVNGEGHAVRRGRRPKGKSATTKKHTTAARQAQDLSTAVLFSCLLYVMICAGVSAWRQGPSLLWYDTLLVAEIILIVLFFIATVLLLKWLAGLARLYVGKMDSETEHRLRVMKYLLFCVFIIVVSALSAFLGISSNHPILNQRPATFWFAIPPSLTVGALPHLQGEDSKK